MSALHKFLVTNHQQDGPCDTVNPRVKDDAMLNEKWYRAVEICTTSGRRPLGCCSGASLPGENFPVKGTALIARTDAISKQVDMHFEMKTVRDLHTPASSESRFVCSSPVFGARDLGRSCSRHASQSHDAFPCNNNKISQVFPGRSRAPFTKWTLPH